MGKRGLSETGFTVKTAIHLTMLWQQSPQAIQSIWSNSVLVYPHYTPQFFFSAVSYSNEIYVLRLGCSCMKSWQLLHLCLNGQPMFCWCFKQRGYSIDQTAWIRRLICHHHAQEATNPGDSIHCLYFFHHFNRGDFFFQLSVCFPVQQAPSYKMGSTLDGKNFLCRSKLLSFWSRPLLTREAEFLPLQQYPFPLNSVSSILQSS